MTVKSWAGWITANEPLLLLAAAPALLFPGPWSAAAALLVPLVWACRRVATGRFSVATPLDGALGVVFAASLAGLVPSAAPARSLARFWTILLGLALFYALANRPATHTARLRAGEWAVVGGVALGVLALIATDWSRVRLVSLGIYRPLAALGHWLPEAARINPRVAGMALAMLIPLSYSRAASGSGGRRKWVWWLATGWMVLVLVLTQAVQAAFGLAVALGCAAAWRKRRFLVAIPVILAAAAVGLLAWGPQQAAGTLLSPERVLGAAVTLRLDMWSRALAMIRDMPFTGIGLDTFPVVQSGFYPGFLIGPEPHAHSLYLQVALDLGVPGLLAFCWLVAALARACRRGLAQGADAQQRRQVAGAAAGIVTYLASGMVDTLWATKPNVLFWLLLGLVVAGLRHEEARAHSTRTRAQWAGAAGLAALAAAGILLFPRLWERNAGMMLAIRSLERAQAAGRSDVQMAAAAGRLDKVVSGSPGSGPALRALARLYGRLGQNAQAVRALEEGMRSDAEAPLAQYAPWIVWARKAAGAGAAPACDDLAMVYAQWLARFPQHAEYYIQTAMLSASCGADPAAARSVLDAGRLAGAQPAGLLAYYASIAVR